MNRQLITYSTVPRIRMLLLLASLCLWHTVFATTIPATSRDTGILRHAFHLGKNEWAIQWPGRVSQYNLVYKSPPIDPMQGIPLGNGDVGALFWCEDSKLVAVINKSDLWDDASFGRFKNHGQKEQDYSTTQRHAFRIIIDFKLPVFSSMYLSDFHASLSLPDASFNLEAQSPFGKISFMAFVDRATGAILYDFKSDLKEESSIDLFIERFGSRTYSNWFNQINRDPTIGLNGTEVHTGQNSVFITQQLSTGTFAGGGKVIESNNLRIDCFREHSRSVRIQLTGSQQKEAKFVFGVVAPTNNNPVASVESFLNVAEKKGLASIYKDHATLWKLIWNKSFMDYGDDYLNNLWHLTMFYLNASQGGRYPGRFVNGLWGWSRDVQNWNFYYHWNQQQLYWPLNAAGFHELITPYLDYRFNSLAHAKEDARTFFDADGAYISDVTERRGYNSLGEKHNHTPVAQIALDFWRQYMFNCDKNFLEKKAFPFILEAANFFESQFQLEDDGLYHPTASTGYEGWILLKDGLTNIAHAHTLFNIAVKAADILGTHTSEVKKWTNILKKLAPLPGVEADTTMIRQSDSGFVLNRGFFSGTTVPANKILAAGWGVDKKKWLTTYEPGDEVRRHNLALLDGIFPSVPSSPVFPSGLIGLEQKGSQLFDITKTTILLYGPEITGWDPVPIALARLGLTKELAKDLELFPQRWQIYNNGWGHWGLEHDVYGKDYHQLNRDAEWFFRTYEVRDVNGTETIPLRMWPFRYTSMEAMSVLATAMNESLLQSHEGVLRFFPAFPNNKTARYTLHAEGGFIVSSEVRSGIVQWISVKSLFGNTCKIELPWSRSTVRYSRHSSTRKLSQKVVEIKTKPGETIQFFPEGKDFTSWNAIEENPLKNTDIRNHPSGKARLGIPRMF